MSETATYQRPESFTVPEGGLASFLTATTGDWADDDNNPIPSSGIAQAKQAAEKLSEFGRYEDTYMVHAAEGETVIPTAIFDENPRLKESLFRQMREMGLEPESYIVGNELNSLNPVTGQPEFFLKKLWKGVKKAVKGVVKVFKKIAPIVLPIALAFTPLGPIYGAMAGAGIGSLIQGKSIGKSLKSALIAGAGAGLMTGLSGGLQGMGTGGVGFGKGFTSGVGNALSSPGARVANLFNPSADQFGTKFLNPNTAVQNMSQPPPPPPNLSASGVNLDKLPVSGSRLPEIGVERAQELGLTGNLRGTAGGIPPRAQTFNAANYQQFAKTPQELAALRTPVGQGLTSTQLIDPNVGSNLADAGQGVNKLADRSKFQTFRDYMVRGGRSKEQILQAQNAAKANYITNTPTNLQSPEGLANIIAAEGPSTLQRFGPSAALGTGVFALSGGFKTPKEEEIAMGPTGQELYDADPAKYGYMSDLGYLDAYNKPSNYNNVYRPTMFAAGGGDAVAFPRRIGGISGPGTGTSDDVPAMLSDGEFVMTADAVRGAGGGNRQRGINNMYSMMRRFEGGLV
jgi:hypothetical protein